MSKKILSMILAAALMLTMAIPAAAAGSNEFSDTKGHWAEGVIDQWSKFEVVQGDGNGKFRPEASMTRGEFATAMVNLLGLTKKTNYNVFTDLKGDEWYAEPILKLHKAGILKGDESKRSNPNARISREESFVMVGRALGITPKAGASLSGYDDADSVSSWAEPMMATLVEEGYIKGVTASTLRPGTNINRASVMQVLSNTVTTYVTEPGTYTAPDKGFVVVKAAEGKVTLQGGADGVIIGQSSQGATVNLDGATISGDVKVDAPNVTVNVKDSKVDGTVEVTAQASGTTLEVAAGSTVENVTTEADKVAVKGEGEVKNVEVTGGDKVEVATPGTTVKVDESAKDSTVTAGGETVKPGESGTTAGTPDGFVEPEPTPDTPSGGGSVTPSGKNSAIGTAVTASTGLTWAGAPADKAMELNYQVNGTTIKASGSLVKAERFTGFNSTKVDQQSGYYAFLKIPVNQADALLAQTASGTLFKINSKTWDKDGDSDGNTGFFVEGLNASPYIELVLRVAEPNDTKAKNVTFTLDWDGDGKDYRETSYTLDFSGVHLLTAAPINGKIAQDPGTTGGSATVSVNGSTATFGGTVAYYDANTAVGRTQPGNYVGVEITAPAGFTPNDTLTSVKIGAKEYTWTQAAEGCTTPNAFWWYPKVSAATDSFTAEVTWAPGYTQTFTVTMNNVTLEPKPVPQPTVKDSLLGGNVIASPNDIGWAGAPAKEYVSLTYAGAVEANDTYTVAATGTLYPVVDFTGFNVPEKKDGYFAAYRLPVSNEVLAAIMGTTAGHNITTNGKTFGPTEDSDHNSYTLVEGSAGGYYIEFISYLAAPDAADLSGKTLTYTFDWDGNGETYKATTYKIDFSAVALSKAIGPAGYAAAKTSARVQSVLNAFETVEFPYFAGNGLLNIPNSESVSVKVELGNPGQYDITLGGTITSGIPAAYEADFNDKQFDPAVAKNGYSAMELINVIPDGGNQTVKQSNGALLLYPQSTWLTDITMVSGTPVKEKAGYAAGNYDFLLADGEAVTIVVDGTTYRITNNMEFTEVNFNTNFGPLLEAAQDSESQPRTATGIEANYNASYTDDAGNTRQVISLTNGPASPITSGLGNAGAAVGSYIRNTFDDQGNRNFTGIGEFTFATFTDLIPKADNVTIVQKNDKLAPYNGENVEALNGQYFGYQKSKVYNKSTAENGTEDRMYSVLVGNSGQNIEIKVVDGGTTTIYTIVSHLTITP